MIVKGLLCCMLCLCAQQQRKGAPKGGAFQLLNLIYARIYVLVHFHTLLRFDIARAIVGYIEGQFLMHKHLFIR